MGLGGGEQSAEGFGDRQAVYGYLLGRPWETLSNVYQERRPRLQKRLEHEAGSWGSETWSWLSLELWRAWPASFSSLSLGCPGWKLRSARTSPTPALESFGPKC